VGPFQDLFFAAGFRRETTQALILSPALHFGEQQHDICSMEQQPFAQPSWGSSCVDEDPRASFYNLGLKLREDTPSARDCFACAPSPSANDEELLI